MALQLEYSIIIPVYNRPQEIADLLTSLSKQTYKGKFEVLVVEDGSSITSHDEVNSFRDQLNVNYLVKENSGPGLSRNHGMHHASGNYFIILDSDVVLPATYLTEVDMALKRNFTDAFGGADASLTSFSITQKAINYSMTALLTTGGIRGKKQLKKFQPRSFNMGFSKNAFEATGGYGVQHFGEDIDLTFRLWNKGFKSQFIENAFVYHKRRTSLRSFFRQTFNFGAARPILNKQHSNSARATYWFPSLFIVGFFLSIITSIFGFIWFLYGYGIYFILLILDSLIKNKNIAVAVMSVITTCIQFFGYGLGFLRSTFRVSVLQYPVEKAFPRMFK